MKPAQFEYVAPRTVAEAVALLDRYGPSDGKVLAGGQSLVPLMNFRLVKPGYLIDINGVTELDGISDDGDWLTIGALTRQRSVERSALVAEHIPLLTEASRWIGHATIRNRGTVGGSLAHSDPAAEYPLAAVLLDAEVLAVSANGARSIPIEGFLVSYLTTALEANELLTAIRFKRISAETGWSFREFSRRHGDFALAAAGALLTLEEGIVSDARLAIGGAGPVAFRARKAEALLQGQVLTDELLEEAAELAAAGADPEPDAQASVEYRRHLVKVLSRQALAEARQRAA